MNEKMTKLLKDKNPLILIVDDIPKNLQVLSNILNTDGYHIAFASNGLQALSVVETTIPDLILLDIMMPEMDGFEVCKKLKGAERTKEIPIIFLTGKAETEDIIKGLQMGAVDYITKPFNSSELLSRVRTHIELKLSRDAIFEYSQELEKASEELISLNKSKDKFFSIIAHDLRGPFTGFIGLSQLLNEEVTQLSQEEVKQIAESMNKAANKLFAFLENLLEWSRSQMGRMEFNPFKLDLSESVTRIISLFAATSSEKQIAVESTIEKFYYVYADSNLLNTVLRNLISNALKFTEKSGNVTVSIQNENDDYAFVSVTDTGVGIDEEAKSKLFRIDTKYTTLGTANEQGTGLGLLLCKELVEKNGGTIKVESEEGKGTSFIFSIPKNPPKES